MQARPIRILIVDDDADLLFLLKHQLSMPGYAVELCPDGIGCIDRLVEHQPQVVFLDISMNGIHGDDLCRQIKKDERFKDVKVLLMSGNLDIQHIADACRADDFIAKPVTPRMIRDKITHLIP